jgi:hypothetical protein
MQQEWKPVYTTTFVSLVLPLIYMDKISHIYIKKKDKQVLVGTHLTGVI